MKRKLSKMMCMLAVVMVMSVGMCAFADEEHPKPKHDKNQVPVDPIVVVVQN